MRATLIYNDTTTTGWSIVAADTARKLLPENALRNTNVAFQRVDFREPRVLRLIDNNIVRLKVFPSEKSNLTFLRARARTS